MPGLVTEAAQFRKELCKAGKKIKSLGEKEAALKEVETEITSIKEEISKLLSSVTNSKGRSLAKSARVCQRQVEIQLLREWEKTFNRNLVSVTKGLAGVKVESVSPWWSRENVSFKVAALDEDAGSTLKAVAKLAQLNKM